MALKVSSMNKKIEVKKVEEVEEIKNDVLDVPCVKKDSEGKGYLYVPKNWKG